MKGNNYLSLFLAAMVSIYSCGEKEGKGSCKISLSSIGGSGISNEMDNLGMDIKFIPLESNDTLLLEGHTIIKYMDSLNIIVESFQTLYRFDQNGKFLNRIGRRGQGPGEYVSPGRVSFDPVNKHLYLFTNKMLQEWSLDCKQLKAVNLPDHSTIQSASAMINDTLLVIRRYYGENGELTQTIQWCDIDGNVYADRNILVDSTQLDIAMMASPEHYRVGNTELFRSEWDNKLYKLKYPEISEFKIYDFGRYNCDRPTFQSGELREKLGDSKVYIEQCIASNDNTWMRYRLDNQEHYVVINDSGECLYHLALNDSEIKQIGPNLANDISVSFWPTYIDDKSNVSCLIYPDALDQESLEYLSSQTGITITEESNPVIVVAY